MLRLTPVGKTMLACLVVAAGLASAAGAQAAAPDPARPSAGDPPQWGFIFDMSSPLQGLESYQGGLGAKLTFGKSAVRGLLQASYNSASGALALELGAVYEYHFLPGRISPYAGASLSGGYLQQGMASAVVPLSAGAVIGVEVYVLDFVSLFAEYSLAFTYTSITDLQLSTTAANFSISTGMGNDAMIGVVVYLPPPRKRS